MLLGEHAHTIDDKNRLTLPARLRESLADGVVIGRGIDSCLIVYTRNQWQEFVFHRLEDLDPMSREARDLRRFLFSAAVETDLDKQGRVTLPVTLLRTAGISKFVVIAGVVDHLEIWDERIWRVRLEDVLRRVGDIADRLSAR